MTPRPRIALLVLTTAGCCVPAAAATRAPSRPATAAEAERARLRAQAAPGPALDARRAQLAGATSAADPVAATLAAQRVQLAAAISPGDPVAAALASERVQLAATDPAAAALAARRVQLAAQVAGLRPTLAALSPGAASDANGLFARDAVCRFVDLAPRVSRTTGATGATGTTGPTQADLRRSFGLLRRPHTAADELTPDAAAALARAGVRGYDPDAVRLLRSTRTGGRAWVVPVDAVPSPCSPAAGPLALLPGRLTVPARPDPSVAPRALPKRLRGVAPPVVRRAVPALPPAVEPLPRSNALPRRVRRAGGRVMLRARVPAPVLRPAPAEAGLVAVAIGDAGVGGGGTGRALVRGLAPAAVEACTGPDDLTTISGVVPDGVRYVDLTRTDGTAIRADVRDNGYALTVPPAGDRAATYVVWTGADGTPHVQPVPTLGLRAGGACPPAASAATPRVSPSGPVGRAGVGPGGPLDAFPRP